MIEPTGKTMSAQGGGGSNFELDPTTDTLDHPTPRRVAHLRAEGGRGEGGGTEIFRWCGSKLPQSI